MTHHGYYVTEGISAEAVEQEARRRLDQGEHVTIHRHGKGQTCTELCRHLVPEQCRPPSVL